MENHILTIPIAYESGFGYTLISNPVRQNYLELPDSINTSHAFAFSNIQYPDNQALVLYPGTG